MLAQKSLSAAHEFRVYRELIGLMTGEPGLQ
jgi:hypothetical protein